MLENYYNTEIKTLTLSHNFNEELKNLPIIYLTFGTHFFRKVDNLPSKLTYLTFDFCLSQKVDNLPKNLTHLAIIYIFTILKRLFH